jgi:hypothetical protein
MKQLFFLLALPFAVWSAQPLFDGPELRSDRHPDHGMAYRHIPSADMHAAMFTEAGAQDVHARVHAFHAEAAQVRLTSLQMAKAAQANAGANDEDMDIQFNLEYGLSDLTAAHAVADSDLNADFNLDNNLSDFSAYTAMADESIDASFAVGQSATVRLSKTDAGTADQEINANFIRE